MAKKRAKIVAKKVRSSEDGSFLIIVGGGFLIVIFALFLFARKPIFSAFAHRDMSRIGKTVIVIKDYQVEPETAYVKAGIPVYWANQDAVTHTIAGTDDSFSTGAIYQGGEGSYTFSTPGAYQYYSSTYPNVRGVIYVE